MMSVVVCGRFAMNFEIYMQNCDKQKTFYKRSLLHTTWT